MPTTLALSTEDNMACFNSSSAQQGQAASQQGQGESEEKGRKKGNKTLPHWPLQLRLGLSEICRLDNDAGTSTELTTFL